MSLETETFDLGFWQFSFTPDGDDEGVGTFYVEDTWQIGEGRRLITTISRYQWEQLKEVFKDG